MELADIVRPMRRAPSGWRQCRSQQMQMQISAAAIRVQVVLAKSYCKSRNMDRSGVTEYQAKGGQLTHPPLSVKSKAADVPPVWSHQLTVRCLWLSWV